MLPKLILLTLLLNWCFYHILQCNFEVYKQNPMDYIHSIPQELELHGLEQSGERETNVRKSKCVKQDTFYVSEYLIVDMFLNTMNK